MLLLHEPLYTVPTDKMEMQLFLSNWQMIMETKTHLPETVHLELVLPDLAIGINQRHAYVCASFITWLGSNMGNALLHRVTNLTKAKEAHSINRWVQAWHETNLRNRSVNYGVRAIEFILAPDDHYKGNRLAKLPEITAQDLETIDQLLTWLDSQSGYFFIAMVNKEIEFKRRTNSPWKL